MTFDILPVGLFAAAIIFWIIASRINKPESDIYGVLGWLMTFLSAAVATLQIVASHIHQ